VPTRHGAPLGAPIWIDLTTSDLDRAQEFYGAVFGWTFASAGPEYGGYVNATKAGHPVAGIADLLIGSASSSGACSPWRPALPRPPVA